MPGPLYAQALVRQKALGYATFSDYVAALLRNDILSRDSHVREESGPYGSSSSPPSEPVESVASAIVSAAALEARRLSKAARPPGSASGRRPKKKQAP